MKDLLDVESYSVSKWGKSVTEKYLRQFENAFTLLESHPDIVLPIPGLGDVLGIYRVEQHLMVCIRRNHDLIVLTVVHASRDIVNLLSELLPTLQNEAKELADRLRKSTKK